MMEYARGDFATALRLFRYFAEQGDSGSQAMLGTYYVNGEGVPKNYVDALKWFRRSADQGDAIGQYQLGVMYHNGQGVPQSDAEAAKWLRLSAAQGYAAAQGKLAILDRKTPVANTLDKRPAETALKARQIAWRTAHRATLHEQQRFDSLKRQLIEGRYRGEQGNRVRYYQMPEVRRSDSG